MTDVKDVTIICTIHSLNTAALGRLITIYLKFSLPLGSCEITLTSFCSELSDSFSFSFLSPPCFSSYSIAGILSSAFLSKLLLSPVDLAHARGCNHHQSSVFSSNWAPEVLMPTANCLVLISIGMPLKPLKISTSTLTSPKLKRAIASGVPP